MTREWPSKPPGWRNSALDEKQGDPPCLKIRRWLLKNTRRAPSASWRYPASPVDER